MNTDLLVFNGVNASRGEYLLPPMPVKDVSALAQGETFDAARLAELRWRHQQATESHYGVKAGIDLRNLAETGWGVIFAHDADPSIREALSPLLEHRRAQVTAKYEHYYKEYVSVDAYRPNESKDKFLARHGAGPGPVDPDNVPYYLLIVGDPTSIPYSFQYQLDVQYAVGRIDFGNDLDAYARYAHSVVEAESGTVRLPRKAAFFGVYNPDDKATELSKTYLVEPLANWTKETLKGWNVDTMLGDAATKPRLSELLGGKDTPAFLFTASHGVGFDVGDPRQLPHQGALLCQEWGGPQTWTDPITHDHYFAGEDVRDDARLLGLLTFHFACYGAGTPLLNDFAHSNRNRERTPIAPHSFVAALPKRLLGHPNGGALAVIGHVERAWGSSFLWRNAGQQLAVFQSTLQQLMEGYPVGAALEFFNERYAELSTSLSAELEEIRFGKTADDLELASMWTANNDARAYAIIGDPAVRLPVVDDALAEAERPAIASVTSRGAAQPSAASTSSVNASPSAATAAAVITEQHDDPVAPEIDYGFRDTLEEAQARLRTSIQQFVYKVGSVLERTVNEIGTLEVATYVSDDMNTVKYVEGRFAEGAELRAVTYIKADGDTLVCVPEQVSEIDQALWNLHLDMVARAQANRAEMLKTAVSAASALLGTLKTP